MSDIRVVKINGTSYNIAGSGGSSINAATSSSANTTIAQNTITKITVAPTNITLTADTETTVILEWGCVFTTGSSQTSVTIAMSDSSTITWSGDPSGLVSATAYSVSVIGNSAIGYTGELVPLFY